MFHPYPHNKKEIQIMSKSNRPHHLHRGNSRYSARMLGIGAVIVGTLAGCSNKSNQATPAPAVQPNPPAAQPVAAGPTPIPTEPKSTQTAIAKPTVMAALPTATAASTGHFKDGEYVGDVERADRWGDLQVRAVIQGGQLTQVDIVASPHSTRRSILISEAALPTLVSEAIQSQDANVDVVSRATDTSYAFVASLESALTNAKP
jgi:uncharacterized protein with FMN-binding domain